MRSFLKACFHQGLGPIARVSLLVSLLAMLPFVHQQSTGAQGAGTTIRLVPANSQISLGGTVTTEVELMDVSDLVVIEFQLRFDPKIVQGVDSADPSRPATQIAIGSFLEGWFIHRNAVWNEVGFIEFEAFQPSESQPISGTGPVAFITWRGIGAGASDLTLEAVLLTNSDGNPIEHSKENGRIEVISDTATPTPTKTSPPTDTPTPIPTATDTPTQMPTDTPSPTHTATPLPTAPPPDTPTFTPPAVATPTDMPIDTPTPPLTPDYTPIPTSQIVGTVLLQGRSVHTGTNIFLGEDPCSGPLSGPPAAVTNNAGYFEITPVPGRTYQCLRAFQAGYLIAQRALPQGDLGTISLPGGDVTQDNVIDISDLTFIANHYRSTDPIADLNADGWVDVYDLAIASGNYGQNGVVTHWR
jgi:hypothetical protein